MKRLFYYLLFCFVVPFSIHMIRKGIQAVCDMHVFYSYMSRRLYIYRSKIPKSSDSCKTKFIRNFLSSILRRAYDSYVDIVFFDKLDYVFLIHDFDIVYLDTYKPRIDFKNTGYYEA